MYDPRTYCIHIWELSCIILISIEHAMLLHAPDWTCMQPIKLPDAQASLDKLLYLACRALQQCMTYVGSAQVITQHTHLANENGCMPMRPLLPPLPGHNSMNDTKAMISACIQDHVLHMTTSQNSQITSWLVSWQAHHAPVSLDQAMIMYLSGGG